MAKAKSKKKSINKQTPLKEAPKAPVEMTRRERIDADRAKCYKACKELENTITSSVRPDGNLVEIRNTIQNWTKQYEAETRTSR